ncbi:actin filament-associated protein 1-like 2 isoform X2 [Denticeps clupeoides]|uniref:PH domain-containing protein n=2 Tax=Denticeps clupeoides TaxID=299321 RepID=A0AAY4DH94_9TELE|nr:actin filament-associated protein 1-like 2 isoform X2 [Denticeps clupeoides]
MDRQRVLTRLILDLRGFLLVLDSENLSYIAQAQKKSISELLSRLQDRESSVEDAEYMIMNCPSGAPGADLRENEDADLLQSGAKVESFEDFLSCMDLVEGIVSPVVPALPPVGVEEDEEDCYEEAEPFVPASQSTEKLDSDSSHYESYGEDEEGDLVKDRAHYIQWSSSQPCLRHTPESRITAYLWRKKWLGQWTRQLFIIRHNLLLCYKCAKDLRPLLELDLRACQLVYRSKANNKMQHELKVVTWSDSITMGFQSCQQAEEWRKAIEEVSGLSYTEPDSHSSFVPKSERQDSCRSSSDLFSHSDEQLCSPSTEERKNKAGFLDVMMNCQWQSLWCQVEDGVLQMFREEGCADAPQYSVQLQGCDVQSAPDSASCHRICLLQHGNQVAVLEASSPDDKEDWMQLLLDGSHQHQSTDLYKLSGLNIRQFPTANMYMDDPFQQLRPVQAQPIYCNSSMLENMFQKSHGIENGDLTSYSNTEIFRSHRQREHELERGVQKLNLTGKRHIPFRAGSEVNLITAGKQSKRTSFRQSLSFCTERAQGSFLSPLLRRTASAKNSLKRGHSFLFIQNGNVFQRRKEWEAKATV